MNERIFTCFLLIVFVSISIIIACSGGDDDDDSADDDDNDDNADDDDDDDDNVDDDDDDDDDDNDDTECTCFYSCGDTMIGCLTPVIGSDACTNEAASMCNEYQLDLSMAECIPSCDCDNQNCMPEWYSTHCSDNDIGGTVYDFLDQVSTLSDAQVMLLNNDTGEPFSPSVQGKTNGDGYIALTPPDGTTQVALLISKSGYIDTISYNHPVGECNLNFYAHAEADLNLIDNFIPTDRLDTKGQLYGHVVWDGQTVGCADVDISPESGTLYYFDALGLPTSSRTSTHPNNSWFLGWNVDPKNDGYTISANTDGEEVELVLPKVSANTITIFDLTYETTANPEPNNCSK